RRSSDLVHDDASDGSSMSTDPLCGGMDDDISTEGNRFACMRRCKSIVDYKRYPASCAISATASISSTCRPGLPIVSPNTALVLSVIAALKFSGSDGSTNVTLMP